MHQEVGGRGDLSAAGAGAAPDRELRSFGHCLLVLAVALAANAIAGPLITGWVTYSISESLLNQLLGLELVTTVLVVPLTLAASVLAYRAHPLAPVLAFGPTAYAVYMFVQYVVGPEYSTYSVVVIAHVAVASLAGILTLWSWRLTSFSPLPPSTGPRRRRRAALLACLAGFVLLRYLPAVVGAVSHQHIPAEFLEARTFYWSIVLLDLGAVVPGTALAAFAVWRGQAAGDRAYHAVLGWFVLVPPSVACMAAVMVLRGDPHASLATVALLGAASAVFAVPAVLAARDLIASPPSKVTGRVSP